MTGCRGINALNIAGQLCEWGAKEQAIELLTLLDSQETLPRYMLASLRKGAVSDREYRQLLAQARDGFGHQVRFPNTLNEVQMLSQLQECVFAQYLLACFHYSKRNYSQAVALWQQCVEREPTFADAWRNLGIYAFNKLQQHDVALAHLQQAFALQPDDARLLFELDQLNKRLGTAPAQRLAMLEQHLPVVARRDDLTAELLSLYNQCDRLSDAQRILQQREFHPWEGGEGKVTGQYLINLQRLAFQALQQGAPQQAQHLLQSALHYPQNLGKGVWLGKATTISTIGWVSVLPGKASSRQRPPTGSRPARGTANWLKAATTTTNRWIICSIAAWRSSNWGSRHRPNSSSPKCSSGQASSLRCCLAPISLPFRCRI